MVLLSLGTLFILFENINISHEINFYNELVQNWNNKEENIFNNHNFNFTGIEVGNKTIPYNVYIYVKFLL
jgi:hypothetical protein